ncbi:MAG: hypothetical protein ACE5PT_09155 [Gemmatimonadales bacterium]
MDPEILQGLGRIMEALAYPLTALIVAGGGDLVARVMRGGGRSELAAIEESLRGLHAHRRTPSSSSRAVVSRRPMAVARVYSTGSVRPSYSISPIRHP